MIRGILSGVTAMRAQVRNQEVIANNLANANTAAYNKDKIVFTSFSDALVYAMEPPAFPAAIGGMTAGTVVEAIETIHQVGPIEVTGNPLDIALPGGQYLAVETTAGIRYTRRGDIEISADGYLSIGGYRLLGESGPIQVEGLLPKSIREDGAVLVGDEAVDFLALWQFPDESLLVKEGTSLFNPDDMEPSQVEDVLVAQGALEKSSVDPVVEMVNLIYAMRSYEAAQKAVQSADETLGQAVNKVGQV
ncbi:MAG: flagellar hook-basal body protein [Bacillota bacterium]